MKNEKKFKYIFSFIFILLGILRLSFAWFREKIDIITIALFLLAFVPWLAKYIKSLEAFGIKADFLISDNKKEEIDKKTKKIANKTKETLKNNRSELDFVNDIYETSDENSRLVLIRYQIERELKILCNKKGIDSFRRSIRDLVDCLRKGKVIPNEIANLILDILPVLNNAVHSNSVKIYPTDFEWVNDKGIMLILYLRTLLREN